ncbi:MAG: methyltransferase domain-containing protein [Nanoarchaeota archaeon]|nr:methyltransferase domain-containing protein [Nanoarchaeota archaeon]
MERDDMAESAENYMSYFGDVDFPVVRAIKNVDRAIFCDNSESAYSDISLEVNGVTIPQPSHLARMLGLLNLKKGHSVLEVGTGSGWTASVLSNIVKPGNVLSLEIKKDFLNNARENVFCLKFDNLKIENKDFWSLKGKFDRIIFSCGIEEDEERAILAWLDDHLTASGVAVCPHVEGSLVSIRRKGSELEVSYTDEEYCFDPLL